MKNDEEATKNIDLFDIQGYSPLKIRHCVTWL